MFSKFSSDSSPKTQSLHTKGKLVVPPNAELIWAEPAILGIVKRKVKLLKNIPLLDRSCYEQSKEADVSEQINIFHLKKDKAHKITSLQLQHSHTLVQSNTVLEEDMQVLIRPVVIASALHKMLMLSPYAYEVATFKPAEKKSNLPESGRGVEVVKRGYAFAEDIKTDKVEYYRDNTEDLFPNGQAVDIREIKQTVLGDCFLLSAIGSILATDNGVDFFMNSMVQQGKYTIVRLNHPEKQKPEFLIVSNKYFCEGNDNTVAHTPWIHMLEKVYAGYAYREVDGKLGFTHPSFRVMYGSGGRSELAFKILTGQDAKKYTINSNLVESIHPWNASACAGALMWASLLSMGLKAEELENQRKIFEKQFNEGNVKNCFKTQENYLLWGEFLLRLKKALPEKYSELMRLIEKMDSLQGRVTHYQASELPEFLEKLRTTEVQTPVELISLLRMYIINPEVTLEGQCVYHYAGVAEEGLYTAQHLSLYKQIKELLASHHCMTASTVEKFNFDVPGLRNNHAYSLLDVKETVINSKTYYFLRLRNPWGEIGRAYLWDKQRSVDFIKEEKSFGVFWIELSDFARYFVDFIACDPIPGLKLTNTFVSISENKGSGLTDSLKQ